jgi:hypothetical protein
MNDDDTCPHCGRDLAERKVALAIINAGFKALAKTLHPDRGGSPEMMAQLATARDRLKQKYLASRSQGRGRVR